MRLEDSDDALIRDRLASERIRRIHVLSWRDLDDPTAGGSEIYLHHVMREWARLGLDVTSMTSRVRSLPARATRDGYRVLRGGGRVSVYPRSIARELLCLAGKPDVVMDVWNGIPWFSPLWARCRRVVLLHHLHTPMWRESCPAPIAHLGRIAETRWSAALYRRHAVVSVGQSSKAELVAALRFDPGRVHVVPPGVGTVFGRGGHRSPEPLVIGVGRLTPAKRFDRLIRAVGQVRSQVREVRLVIVGEGGERESLERQIRRMRATEWVSLTGRVSTRELVTLYRRAWLLASASVTEGWGMTVTEAARCGTPAVVTDVVGHRDSVIPGVTGHVVPEQRLGETIAAVLVDAEARASLGAAAATRAESLTWRSTAHALLDAFLADE